jgi:hypothetical protein
MSDTPLNLIFRGNGGAAWGEAVIGGPHNERRVPVYLTENSRRFLENLILRVGGPGNYVIADLAGLTFTDGSILVGNGSGLVLESGATARQSLGLIIGTDVQAFDQGLEDISDLADPGADRILFWDDSAGAHKYLTAGSGLSLTDTTLTATGGSGGAITLLEQHTASASATLDFTSWYSSTYDEYIIRIIDVIPATDNTDLQVLASTNGGSSYDTSAIYDFQVQLAWSNTTSEGGSLNNTVGPVAGNIGNDSTGGVAGSLTLSNPGSTTTYKKFYGVMEFFHATLNQFLNGPRGFVYKNTSAVNALRFKFSSGNIASGTIRIYGVAKS